MGLSRIGWGASEHAHAAHARTHATRIINNNTAGPSGATQAASESLISELSGGKPFISNITLMKIIGSQNSIGMARFLMLNVIYWRGNPMPWLIWFKNYTARGTRKPAHVTLL